MALWTDRAGRFSPLKFITLLIAVAPGLWVAFAWATDDLGAKPLTEALHQMGEWAIRFLIATLAITPARKVLNWPKLILIRRMLGVTTMTYALIHVSLYIVQQHLDLFFVASEIVLRFYLTIGFVALLGLIALGWTSTDSWVKRLGKKWTTLHRLVYVIATLGLFHYALQLKIDVTKAVLLTGLFVWLMGYRLIDRRRWPINFLSLGGLSVVAALATAAVEALWYAIGTGISAASVLSTNLSLPTDLVALAMQALGIGAETGDDAAA
ncbi:MAG: sulfoxide reductase heme-binding subunit YedZ, partial [Methylobacteriaceae bacterium]|nr:sulfoxide reductase heme-binding subunit YedZ [Methylobacteriaceae bacterium]